MKKLLIFLIVLLSVFLLPTSSALAHSGCCSHHDGVRTDGCGCNDGTPLSDTCAPYYTCTSNQQSAPAVNDTYVPPVYVPPTDIPTLIPTQIPTPTFIPTSTPTPTLAPTVIPTLTRKPTQVPVKKVLATQQTVSQENDSTPFTIRILMWILGW